MLQGGGWVVKQVAGCWLLGAGVRKGFFKKGRSFGEKWILGVKK